MRKLSAEIVLEKINTLVPNYATFERKLVNHIHDNHFPIMYQYLSRYFMPLQSKTRSTDDFKRLLHNGCLRLLNDIYRTRLSEGAFGKILKRLDLIDNFDDYRTVLRAFDHCNPRKREALNAYSLGTKVLHTFNPTKNPILDTRVRTHLKISTIDLNVCCVFREAMNDFAEAHESFFALDKSEAISEVLRKRRLTADFPKMKIIDMVLLEKW